MGAASRVRAAARTSGVELRGPFRTGVGEQGEEFPGAEPGQ
ncbi:hypothetical protein [Streptomyces anulatus]